MSTRNPSYRYALTWRHTTGGSPDVNLRDEVTAPSVPRAVAKLRKLLLEAGYARNDVLVIDAQNMDIC